MHKANWLLNLVTLNTLHMHSSNNFCHTLKKFLVIKEFSHLPSPMLTAQKLYQLLNPVLNHLTEINRHYFYDFNRSED